MCHRLPMSRKRRPADTTVFTVGRAQEARRVEIPAGRATLGAVPDQLSFGWDNEFPRLQVDVPAFVIDAHNVTNQQYLEFVAEGGYTNPEWWSESDWVWRTDAGVEHPPFWFGRPGEWCWRGMFELITLPTSWPVYVSHAEASAYARWERAAAADRSRVSPRRVRHAGGCRARLSVGRGADGCDPREFRVPTLGAGAGRVVPPRG